MPFQNLIFTYQAKEAVNLTYPFYGVAARPSTINEGFVLSLPLRGPNVSRICTFTLTDTLTTFMWFAYPTSYGLATFTDTVAGLQGGWDGANNDPFNLYGPVTISVLGTQFYVYRTDFENLGNVTWAVS